MDGTIISINRIHAIAYFGGILRVLKAHDNFHLKNKNEKLWKLILIQIMDQIRTDLTHIDIKPTSLYSTAAGCDQLIHKSSYIDSYEDVNILSIVISQ